MSLEVGLDTPWRRVLSGAWALVLLAGPLRAQDDPMAGLEHRFADSGGLQIEYFQFGDTGTPIILIQDHHDYFHDVYRPGEFDELREWIGFLNELGRNHRVVTPVRRGWGESDDPGYGYDVATQAEDVLGVMDRLGIAQAVLLGRTLATQEITWIAEHHPERVLGLAYWGTPMGHLPDPDPTPEVTRFGEMYNRRACDIGGGDGETIDARLDPRRGWRPHFTRDESRRIEIPTRLVLHPVFDRVSMESRRLDRIVAWAPDDFGDPDGWCDEEARAYFTELSRDPERIASLRQAFDQLDGLSRTQEAMRRAFGSHLVVAWEEEQPDNPVFGPLISAVDEFVRTLEGAGRSDETPPSDSLVTATVMARTRDLADAWERLDADAYLTHFSDDFTFYFEGSRVSRVRFETVVRESIGSLRESTFEILNPEMEALGPGGATISFELREVMVDASGATTELNAVMTLVYERRGGRWLIVRAHESLLQQRER